MTTDSQRTHQDEDDEHWGRLSSKTDLRMDVDADRATIKEERERPEPADSRKVVKAEEPIPISISISKSDKMEIGDDDASGASSGLSSPNQKPLKEEEAELRPKEGVGPDENQTRDECSSRSPTPALITLGLTAEVLEDGTQDSTPNDIPNEAQPGARAMAVERPSKSLSGLGVPFELRREESEVTATETNMGDVPSPTREMGQTAVDMDRLMNSIEITKRATFLRQRLSSLGTRPSGLFRQGPTMDKLDNPFSSPPGSPSSRDQPGWREQKQPGTPSTPAGLTQCEVRAARTPITPGRKRKLDYGASPFRSPGDLMALTLESPDRKGDELDTVNKRRGKTWVSLQPGSTAPPPVVDHLSRLGRRASMGTGPRLGIALPRRTVEQPQPVPPRRAMGIEGYLADRYGDVARYPPPLPSAQALASSAKLATSTASDRYVSFMGAKKPRSASHSVARRPGIPGAGTGEMTEAANVLTGMLGGSPLRKSTASPVRPERAGKPYARPDGEELGFRAPPARAKRPMSTDPEPLPPLLSSGQITPPKQISRLPRVRHTDGALARPGSDEDDHRAAELMIFLAQSPGSTEPGETTRPKRRSMVQAAGVGRVLFDGSDGKDDEMRDLG